MLYFLIRAGTTPHLSTAQARHAGLGCTVGAFATATQLLPSMRVVLPLLGAYGACTRCCGFHANQAYATGFNPLRPRVP